MKQIGLLVILGILVVSSVAFGEPLQIVMDYYPPLSYAENGEIKGVSTQVLHAVLKEAGLEAVIDQLPFARAYKMAQDEVNVFEYCVSKTPEREALFQWVGIVGPSEQVLFARKDQNIRIGSSKELKQYLIGTTIEDVVDQYLRSKEKPWDLQLDRTSSSYETNMKKLLNGRIDLWGGNKLVGLQLAKDLGGREGELEVAFTIEALTAHYYLVTGLKTPKELVEKLRRAFQTVHENGTYQKILDEYFQTNSAS